MVYSSVLRSHYAKHLKKLNVIFLSQNFIFVTSRYNNIKKMSMAEFSLLVLFLLLIFV